MSALRRASSLKDHIASFIATRNPVQVLLGLAPFWVAGSAFILIGPVEAGIALQCAALAAGLIWFGLAFPRWKTQQQEINRLRRVTERRADQVSVLFHEVRTPLAMIKGAADLLIDGSPGPLTPHQQTFLNTISQNCERTIALAEDMLMQARIDAGLFKLRIEPTDLRTLMRRVTQSMKLVIARQQQALDFYSPQILSPAYVDPGLMQQVIENLLQNASRYTSRGGHMYVSLAENEDAHTIAVTDDGAGMSASERRNLFQKFMSGRALGDGTGLGLVISKQIVEHHGGRILVDTDLGQGTTFLVILPRLGVKT